MKIHQKKSVPSADILGILVKSLWVVSVLILSSCQSENNKKTDDVSRIVDEVAGRQKKAKSYRTQLTLKDLIEKAKDKDCFTIEWTAQYVSPDKYFVDQVASEKMGTVYDTWISIGKDHYFKIGGWFKEKRSKEKNERDNNNKFLMADKWIKLLRDNDIQSSRTAQEAHQEYTVFELSPRMVNLFEIENSGQKTIYICEIWLDKASGYIVKASLKITGQNKEGNKIDLQFDQRFYDYDSEIKIERPERYLELK